MRTQITHQLHCSIQLNTIYDGEYPIKGLPPHITRGNSKDNNKIMAVEYLTYDGPLYWYSLESKSNLDFRFRDKAEELKLMIVTKGKFMLKVREGVTWSLSSGYICLLNSCDYKIVSDTKTKAEFFIFPIKSLKEKYEWDCLLENRFLLTNKMEKIIDDIIYLHQPLKESSIKIANYLSLLLVEVKVAAEEGQEVGSVDPKYRDILYAAKEYIIENLRKNPLQTKEIAVFARTNECTLKREFKKHFKKTLNEFQNYYRILESEHLLCEGTRNIEEVALFLGFLSANTFRDHFFNHFGVNPSDWLNK